MTKYRLSEAAQSDIIEILGLTHTTFGAAARKRYEKLLVTALRDVARDPFRSGTSLRPEVADDVRSYHLLTAGKGREVKPAWLNIRGICCFIAC
ncbi:type II toxin-antitoxin system RelE/ParE family toxin [Agrobacterium tumefaciens]|nr:MULTISPECIES: type II toxin-antitoxin system RelE/ParE family toxin [Agrobacterium]MDA5243598.1 type II toxin-antitoxin system RelE/ParE family toxin [Agrobacterium sp. MAFF310724]MDA5249631.1 type II toxin-antitoxin system RelE/ParE family toxin [Agrobacterium sp. MAFF210268]WCA59831.1 type II toxin-antitoxin system RelE/ParE family toxin [Agrobacterium tumefaciens]